MFTFHKKDKATPAPVTPDDLVIADLLVKHADLISEIKQLCADDLAPQEAPDFLEKTPGGLVFDDIAILRYCLSFKKAPAAAKAIKAAVEYRTKAAYLVAPEAPHHTRMTEFFVGGFHGTMKDGGPIFWIRDGFTDMGGMVAKFTGDEILENWMWWKERLYHMCDKMSREKGRIIKSAMVEDMKGFSMSIDRKFFKIAGDISSLAENVYPCAIGAQILLNPPSYIKMIVRVARLFISAKTMNKMRVCPGPSSKHPSMSACPFASRFVDESEVPSFAGGTCTHGASGECFENAPNVVFTQKQRQAYRLNHLVIDTADDNDGDEAHIEESLKELSLAAEGDAGALDESEVD